MTDFYFNFFSVVWGLSVSSCKMSREYLH